MDFSWYEKFQQPIGIIRAVEQSMKVVNAASLARMGVMNNPALKSIAESQLNMTGALGQINEQTKALIKTSEQFRINSYAELGILKNFPKPFYADAMKAMSFSNGIVANMEQALGMSRQADLSRFSLGLGTALDIAFGDIARAKSWTDIIRIKKTLEEIYSISREQISRGDENVEQVSISDEVQIAITQVEGLKERFPKLAKYLNYFLYTLLLQGVFGIVINETWNYIKESAFKPATTLPVGVIHEDSVENKTALFDSWARRLPNDTSKRIIQVCMGQQVIVLEKKRAWMRVKYYNGSYHLTGWVRMSDFE